MKTFWIILLVAFLVSIIVYAIRSRRHSSDMYRARFFSRMPRARHPQPDHQDSTIVMPVIIGAASGGIHAPASTPYCAPEGADAGDACSSAGDGGGATP